MQIIQEASEFKKKKVRDENRVYASALISIVGFCMLCYSIFSSLPIKDCGVIFGMGAILIIAARLLK